MPPQSRIESECTVHPLEIFKVGDHFKFINSIYLEVNIIRIYMTFFQHHLLSSKLTNSKLFTRIFANYFLTLDEFYWYTDWGTFRAYDKDER